MTKEFQTATEKLYSTFSKYQLNSTIEGCPCCVSDTDKSTLHSKPLRKLEDEDLSRYAFKAMTTWGDVNDYKHYLPRIFELTATRKLIVDTFVTLGKLDYGNWKEWDNNEQESINEFLKAWWKYDINTATYFDTEIFIELNKLIGDIPSMLKDWNLNVDSQGFRNYVDLIEDYYYELKGKNKTFKKLSDQELTAFINWIEINSSKLEAGFFEYAETDKAFSDRISYVQYMFEKIE